MKKNKSFPEIKQIFEDIKQNMIFLAKKCLSPHINSRCSTLSSNVLATVLARAALGMLAEKPNLWEGLNAPTDSTNTHMLFSDTFPFMCACYAVLNMYEIFLPSKLQEKIPPVEKIAEQLNYPYSLDSSYTLPLHLACDVLLSTKGVNIPEISQRIYDLQQQDGSWTDDVIITALSALALQKGGINPKYDAQKWLKREQLPDGWWAAANGEVWEASYALRTGEFPTTTRLLAVLNVCMHPNYWWGFSRYAVPDTDDTAAACCALAPYEPEISCRACENLLSVQNEDGGWGAFPQITGVVPHESVIKNTKITSNDVTCHVLEALEQNNKSGLPSFRKGMYYLLEAQEQDGHWKTTWWNSDIYATSEIALLMNRNGCAESAFHGLDWLEKALDNPLNIVEYALLIKTFSQFPVYSDSLNKAIQHFLDHFSDFSPVFDSVYFAGLIDCTLYRISTMVSSLRTFLKRTKK